MKRAAALMACAGVVMSLAGCLGSASRPPDARHLASAIEALRPHTVWADYAPRGVTCTIVHAKNEVVCDGWLVRQATRHYTKPRQETVARIGAGFRFRLDANGDLGRPICAGGSGVGVDWAFCGPHAT